MSRRANINARPRWRHTPLDIPSDLLVNSSMRSMPLKIKKRRPLGRAKQTTHHTRRSDFSDQGGKQQSQIAAKCLSIDAGTANTDKPREQWLIASRFKV